MTRRELTPLQVELIERHRQRNSGRGTITATAEKIEVAPSRRAKSKPETWTDKIDVDDIWHRWNAPRGAAEQSLQQHVEEDEQKAEPVLDADAIYAHWNKRQPAGQEG